MKLVKMYILLLSTTSCSGQGNFPWERPLKMAWSSDGTNFSSPAIFQDSSGVPSIIKWKGDTMVCAFQWFRQPKNSITWDKVAVKFSYNAGLSWTAPVPITVNNLPATYQRPFDPTLAVLNNNSIRIYFSSSDGMPTGGLNSAVNTYSASSNDGINYTFEPNPRFDHPSKPVIDPAVIYFNGSWHYTAPAGAPQDGAYHCTANDGINFTQLNNLSSDMQHNWTGNLMLNSAAELRFYGSGSKIWHNSSSDGSSWQGYINTNLTGGDPAVIKVSSSNYLAVYVGEPYPAQASNTELVAYPNPFSNYIMLRGNSITGYEYVLYNATGQKVSTGKKLISEMIQTAALSRGIYFLAIASIADSKRFKLVKQ